MGDKRRGPIEDILLPRLHCFDCPVPTRPEDIADPLVACYATHLSVDWCVLYIQALVATEKITQTAILRSPGELYFPEITELWTSRPLTRSGETLAAYDVLREVLMATVEWLKRNQPFFLRETQEYIEILHRARLLQPDETVGVTARGPRERDWTIYRWREQKMIVLELSGFNPLATEIASSNLPEYLRGWRVEGETTIALMKVPGGIFSRYELWSRPLGFDSKEHPPAAVNHLFSTLADSEIVRIQLRRFTPFQGYMLSSDENVRLQDYLVQEFSNLDFASTIVESEKALEHADMAAWIRAHFPDAKHR
jgi:hypothetical protein